MIQKIVWDGGPRGNTMEGGLQRIEGLFTSDGFDRFLATLFGHLYTFCTSTLGIGVLAIVFFIVMCSSRISEWYKNRKELNEDGTRVYEPTKHPSHPSTLQPLSHW